MTIILASDHAGYAHKEIVKKYLQNKGLTILDVGAHQLIEGDDYPTYMAAAALKVAEDAKGETKAILFGGSGQGEAIVANRFPGVRATVYCGGDKEIVRLAREHNDSNVLSIGARFVDEASVNEIVDMWLATSFSGDERHKRRIEQIDSIN